MKREIHWSGKKKSWITIKRKKSVKNTFDNKTIYSNFFLIFFFLFYYFLLFSILSFRKRNRIFFLFTCLSNFLFSCSCSCSSSFVTFHEVHVCVQKNPFHAICHRNSIQLSIFSFFSFYFSFVFHFSFYFFFSLENKKIVLELFSLLLLFILLHAVQR